MLEKERVEFAEVGGKKQETRKREAKGISEEKTGGEKEGWSGRRWIYKKKKGE